MRWLLYLLLLVPLVTVSGATSTFEVGFTVNENDINAPSVPTGLSATGVATNQIDISWASSTDNVSVAGYRIFRDGIFIATSTVLTYQDIGLSAGTSYTYEVSAFDSALNESARSASVTASTLSLPTPTADTSANGAVAPRTYAALSPNTTEVSIESYDQSAKIVWSAPQYLVSKIEWGKTLEYEIGSSFGPVYSRRKETIISGLEPNTRYYFRTEYVDAQGRVVAGETGSFQTTAGERSTVTDYSHIISNIALVRDSGEIVISWNTLSNPPVLLRVLSGPDTATFSEDGMPVYEGYGNTLTLVPPKTRTVYSFFALGVGEAKPIATVMYDPGLALPSLLEFYFGSGLFGNTGGRGYVDVSVDSTGKSIFDGGGIVFDENGAGRETEFRSVLESEYYRARSCQAGFWLCNWWLILLIIASVLYGLFRKFGVKK